MESIGLLAVLPCGSGFSSKRQHRPSTLRHTSPKPIGYRSEFSSGCYLRQDRAAQGTRLSAASHRPTTAAEAPKSKATRATRIDWAMVCHASCSALLDSTLHDWAQRSEDDCDAGRSAKRPSWYAREINKTPAIDGARKQAPAADTPTALDASPPRSAPAVEKAAKAESNQVRLRRLRCA